MGVKRPLYFRHTLLQLARIRLRRNRSRTWYGHFYLASEIFINNKHFRVTASAFHAGVVFDVPTADTGGRRCAYFMYRRRQYRGRYRPAE